MVKMLCSAVSCHGSFFRTHPWRCVSMVVLIPGCREVVVRVLGLLRHGSFCRTHPWRSARVVGGAFRMRAVPPTMVLVDTEGGTKGRGACIRVAVPSRLLKAHPWRHVLCADTSERARASALTLGTCPQNTHGGMAYACTQHVRGWNPQCSRGALRRNVADWNKDTAVSSMTLFMRVCLLLVV